MGIEPTWQHIRSLPLITMLIDDQLEDAKFQFKNFEQAKEKPHVLNNSIIERTLDIYGEQLEFLWIYEKQLSKWIEEEELLPEDQKEIQRLKRQVKKLKTYLTDILSIAENMKGKTIESVLAKSDFELGLEYLQKMSKGKG